MAKALPAQPPAGISMALTRGLEVLRHLAEAHQPLTSTALAKRVALDQSWVSRVLSTLRQAGYVRKPDYHSFAVDYGVLTLGGNALLQIPFCAKPRAAMQALAERSEGLTVSLATLWDAQLIYFMRMQKGHEPVPLSVGFPLHLSSVALRLLSDRPKAEALEALRASKRRYGWERPTAKVPRSPEEAWQLSRACIRHECAVLEDYYQEGLLSCTIPIEVPGEPRAALALSGPRERLGIDTVLLLLQEGRRSIEAAMTAPKPTAKG